MSANLDAMPLLASCLDAMPKGHFAGVEVVYVNHLISDSLMVARALADGGARVWSVGLPYGSLVGPVRQGVIAGLGELGPAWVPEVTHPLAFSSQVRVAVREALLAATAAGSRPVLVVEDGGYAVPMLHDDPTLRGALARCLGAVEHTTRGRLNDEFNEVDDIPVSPRQLRIPVVTIAASRLKSIHEPPFVGQAIVDELAYLLRRRHQFLRYRRAVVLGFGRIGEGVAGALVGQGVEVTVIEPEGPVARRAAAAGFDVYRALTPELLQGDGLVVGVTGMPSFTASHLAWFLAGAGRELVLVSGSSKEIEFSRAMAALEADPVAEGHHDVDLGRWWDVGRKRVTVLADGYPVIFFPAHTNGAPNLAMDPVMTQLYLASCFLRANADRLAPGVHHVDTVDDQRTELRRGPWDVLFDSPALLRRWYQLARLETSGYLDRINLC